MRGWIGILAAMILLPVIYAGGIFFYRDSFKKEENRHRIPMRTPVEIIALLFGEAALFCIWRSLGRCCFFDLTFELCYFMLAGMLVLCMTDYWEKIVPNRILLLLVMIWVLIVGFHALEDFEQFYGLLSSVVLGIFFCTVSFGACYIISRGSMGAGDVKLSIVMGMYLTGEYVVGAVLYGCVISAVVSVILLLAKKVGRKDVIPFVPFLYIGLIIRFLMG